jgi:hypothetical protein
MNNTKTMKRGEFLYKLLIPNYLTVALTGMAGGFLVFGELQEALGFLFIYLFDNRGVLKWMM